MKTDNHEQGLRIADDVKMGKGVSLHSFANLYGCEIGDETSIGTFVEIQKGVKVGARCKISSHSFLCEGVTLGEGVFVGHGVMFTNDRYPAALNDQGEMKSADDWFCEKTVVEDRVSIGSGVTILCGVNIGEGALIGAGSVLTKDVPTQCVVAGNPAKVIRQLRESD